MHFLPDVYVTCDVCKGKRYNRETLEVQFKGKSIADVLDMTVEEARRVLQGRPLDPRQAGDAGARSGSATSRSASRRRRCRAARRSASSSPRSCPSAPPGRTLYILDEPTTGLHFDDVASCSRCCTSWSTRATRWSSSSTISRSSRPPTGSSTSAPRAATAAARSWRPARRRTEVPVELIEDDTAWSPYLSPEDVNKLDTVRLALRRGDVATASKYGRVFELMPLD
jgi:hypothetical protein